MKTTIYPRSLQVLFFFGIYLGLSHYLVAQGPSEYFDHAEFLTHAGSMRVVNFDSLAPGDNALSGEEFFSQGLRIIQRNELGINVIQNTVAGSYGPNYVTEANINSAPNAISASVMVSFASPDLPDDFDFILLQPANAAGLFVGNLGEIEERSTVIQFLDETNGIIAFQVIDGNHPGVINGSVEVTWDNRIFYGITSVIPIKTIRVSNGPNDNDGIVIDDIQYSMPVELRISYSNSEVQISWTADSNNWQLQSTSTLSSSPIPWTPVIHSPIQSGNDWTVTEPAPTGSQFYRLQSVP